MEGVTGLGFDSMMGYVDYAEPEIVIAENVATLTHTRKKFDNECPIEIQEAAFKRRGYVGFHELLNSCDFGLSQSRTRCWAIYFKVHREVFLG